MNKWMSSKQMGVFIGIVYIIFQKHFPPFTTPNIENK